jgi:5,10-methylenetetrahydromethanopterin reductase
MKQPVVELGISLGWSHREPAERMIQLVRDAERAGISACWVIDSQLAMRDAFTLLALLSRETNSIRLGPGVTNLITRHPSVVANSLLTLRSLAPGRVLVGIGAGDSAVYPLGLKPQSIEGLRESVAALRALLAGEALDGPAGPIRLAGAEGPAEPVYLAASQPRMLHLAGAIADGVIIMGPADPEVQRAQMDAVDGGAAEAGRSPEDVFRDVWVTMAMDGEERGVDAVRSWASAQARWLGKWRELPVGLRRFEGEMRAAADTYDFERHLSLSAGHAGVVSDELATALAVAGSVAECAQRIEQMVEVGVDRITISLLSGGRERRLRDLLSVWEAVEGASTVGKGGLR